MRKTWKIFGLLPFMLNPGSLGTFPSNPAAHTVTVAASTSVHKENADYVCDGIDDQVEINAALDYLASLPNVGSLNFLEGLFSISAPIVIPDVLYGLFTISGRGAGATTIYAANGSNCNLIQTNITSGHQVFLIMRDIMIQGNRANNPTGGRGFYDGVGSGTCKDTLFQNMFFYNCHGNCAEWTSCWGAKIIDSIFEDSDAKGIYCSGGTDIRMVGNKFIHVLGSAIETNAPASYMVGNFIEHAGNGNFGIKVLSGANYSVVEANEIHHDTEFNSCTGIYSAAGYGVIGNNIVESATNTAFAYGIQLAAASSYNIGVANQINISGGLELSNAGTANSVEFNSMEKPKGCRYSTSGLSVSAGDNSIFINSGSPQSVTLPASPYIGQIFHVFNLGSGTVTIMGNGNNINGSATKTVSSLVGYDLTYFYSGNWAAK